MMNKVAYWLEQRQVLSRTFWLVAWSLFSSLLFLLFQGGKLAMMLFCVVAVVSIYLGLGRWSGISATTGTRSLMNTAGLADVEAGTSLQIKVNVKVPGYWPIPYIIIKEKLIRRKGRTYDFEATIVPDWKRNGEIVYATPPLRRGFYYFDQTVCSTEDIFGLFQHQGSLDLKKSFSVLPKTVYIREWQQFNQMVKGYHHHSTTNRASRETTQINGVREYVYGDRISRIHWKTTARTGTWKSKEFERESLPKSIIILDRNYKSYQHAEQFEMAVSAAASLCNFGLHKDLAVGLFSSGQETTYIDAKRGLLHHKMMINHLTEVEADSDFSLVEVLQGNIDLLSQGMFVMIISPEHQSESLLQSMNWIKQRQMSPCHLWLAPPDSSMKLEEWPSYLKSRGHYGYAIRTLQDLPRVLGGRF